MVTEGCIAAYRGHWDQARDRLERARVLSSRIGDKESELLACAWLSYLAFIGSDFEKCVSFAQRVIKERNSASEFALFRAYGIVVLLFHLAGRSIEAEQWFKDTKRIAESLQEPGATSVIIFDIAAMRASCRRFDNRGTSNLHDSASGLDLLFARSARSFDEIGSVCVMPSLHMLLESQILNSLGRFEEAKKLSGQALSSPDPLPTIAVNQARLELLWACAQSNHNIDHPVRPEEWQSEIVQLIDDDDITVYCQRASSVLQAAGMLDEAEDFESRANDAAGRFLGVRDELWSMLQPVHNLLGEILVS